MNVIISHVYSKDNKGDAALLSVLIADIKREFHHANIHILNMDYVQAGEHFEGIKMSNSYMYYALKTYSNNYLRILNSFWVMLISLLWAFFQKYFGISLPIDSKLRKLCILYKDSDIILPVGGGYLRSQNLNIDSIINLLLLLHPLVISKIFNKFSVLYSQSIGPFRSNFEKELVKNAINQCVSAVLAREDTTVTLLKEIGVQSDKIYRTIDSGFAFQNNEKTFDLKKELGISANSILFGITGRVWLSGKAQLNYENALESIVIYITKKYKASVVFIPQVTSEFHKDDDRLVHERIRKNLVNNNKVYLFNKNIDHFKIKAAYDSLDFLIGTRFHSVIFSLTSYIPVIAIEYEHKTGGIMRDLGLSEWVIKIEEVNQENLISKVDKMMTSHVKYQTYLKKVIPPYIKKCNATMKIVKTLYNQK